MSDKSDGDLQQELARSLCRGGMEGVHVISQEVADDVLTPKRRDIIHALDQDTYESVSALAESLGRDQGNVTKDLQALCEQSIVTYDEDSGKKSPRLVMEHIVVEPII